MNSYALMLKDPRWQRLRLEVLKRDDFTCQYCESTTKELNVHHTKYGKYPWDIEKRYLITLCNKCHNLLEERISDIKQSITEMQVCYNIKEIPLISDIIANLCCQPVELDKLKEFHKIVKGL